MPGFLEPVLAKLADQYGPVPRDPLPLGNKTDPLDELVYIMLTLMTRSQPRIDRAYCELQELSGRTWVHLLDTPVDSVREALWPLGFVERRTDQLLRLLSIVTHEYGGDLDGLQELSDEEALAALVALPGVGVKTAKCVLMYSLDRPVLPVDVHVARVAERLGILPFGVTLTEADELLEPKVPPSLRFDVHVQFVRHGRSVCRRPSPDCGVCLLSSTCPTATAV